jgi:transposase-like protein
MPGPRLTVERQIVTRITRLGESIKRVARAVGICPKTVRKWVSRAHAGGSLMDRSSRPQHVPTATPTELIAHVVRLRRQRWTSTEIAERLRLGRSRVAPRAAKSRVPVAIPPRGLDLEATLDPHTRSNW